MRLDTPAGAARVLLHGGDGARGALLLGHGAGGGFGAKDLVMATETAVAAGLRVAQVEQPYRVAGKKSAAPAPRLDEAWIAVAQELGRTELSGLPLVVGGRSSGARVACRTAAQTGAAGVLCLAFPLHPPGKPEKTRLPELEAVRVPVLIIQGDRDPFGMPPDAPDREIVAIPGTHALNRSLDAASSAIARWLDDLL
jgi:predicted alpha/beta-hydrolase family hydrolase